MCSFLLHVIFRPHERYGVIKYLVGPVTPSILEAPISDNNSSVLCCQIHVFFWKWLHRLCPHLPGPTYRHFVKAPLRLMLSVLTADFSWFGSWTNRQEIIIIIRRGKKYVNSCQRQLTGVQVRQVLERKGSREPGHYYYPFNYHNFFFDENICRYRSSTRSLSALPFLRFEEDCNLSMQRHWGVAAMMDGWGLSNLSLLLRIRKKTRGKNGFDSGSLCANYFLLYRWHSLWIEVFDDWKRCLYTAAMQ